MSEFVTTEQAPNLLINGGFDEETPQGLVPTAWVFENTQPKIPPASLDASSCLPSDVSALSVGSIFERVTEAQPLPGYRHFIRFNLTAGASIRMKYRVLQRSNSMDILRDGLEWARWRTSASTLGFSFRVRTGAAKIKVRLEADPSGTIQEVVLGDFGNRNWARQVVNFAASADSSPLDWVFEYEALNNQAAEIEVTAFQWIFGTFTEAPFTGDFSYQVIPRNTIILMAGPLCPAGTRKLIDSDKIEEEALSRAVIAGETPGTLRGTETHSHIVGGPLGVARATKKGGGNNRWIPWSDQHTHTLSEAINRPMTRPMTFCIKL